MDNISIILPFIIPSHLHLLKSPILLQTRHDTRITVTNWLTDWSPLCGTWNAQFTSESMTPSFEGSACNRHQYTQTRVYSFHFPKLFLSSSIHQEGYDFETCCCQQLCSCSALPPPTDSQTLAHWVSPDNGTNPTTPNNKAGKEERTFALKWKVAVAHSLSPSFGIRTYPIVKCIEESRTEQHVIIDQPVVVVVEPGGRLLVVIKIGTSTAFKYKQTKFYFYLIIFRS